MRTGRRLTRHNLHSGHFTAAIFSSLPNPMGATRPAGDWWQSLRKRSRNYIGLGLGVSYQCRIKRQTAPGVCEQQCSLQGSLHHLSVPFRAGEVCAGAGSELISKGRQRCCRQHGGNTENDQRSRRHDLQRKIERTGLFSLKEMMEEEM